MTCVGTHEKRDMPGEGHAIKTKPGIDTDPSETVKVLVSADFGDRYHPTVVVSFLSNPRAKSPVLGQRRVPPRSVTRALAGDHDSRRVVQDRTRALFRGCREEHLQEPGRNHERVRARFDAIGRPKRIPALFVSRADSTPRPRAFPFHRNRPQLAAVLAADTGLGLAPWELKLFLKELDLGDDDRVSADRFCGIYTFLASRPPTPAAAPRRPRRASPRGAAAPPRPTPRRRTPRRRAFPPRRATKPPSLPRRARARRAPSRRRSAFRFPPSSCSIPRAASRRRRPNGRAKATAPTARRVSEAGGAARTARASALRSPS